tara:strand:+ start:2495 stop:3919 length:1425 start_codon:yes stop_codon:yes gene_type:complete
VVLSFLFYLQIFSKIVSIPFEMFIFFKTKHPRGKVVVFCFALLWGVSSNASAIDNETNREIARTISQFYLEQKNFEEAENTLISHLKEDPKDHRAWNLLGLSYSRDGQTRRAASAFYRASRRSQGTIRAVYLYNYANMLNQIGKGKQAKKILNFVNRYDETEESANHALEVMKPRQPLPDLKMTPPAVWSLSSTLTTGYDSNVLLISDSSSPATAASSMASPVFIPAIRFGYEKPWLGGSFVAGGNSSFSYYSNVTTQSFNTWYTGLTSSWKKLPEFGKGWGIQVGDTFSLTFLNSNSTFNWFSWVNSVDFQTFYYFSETSYLTFSSPIKYQSFNLSEGTIAENDRTGFGVKPGVAFQSVLGKSIYSFGIHYDIVFASGKNFKSNTIEVPFWINLPIFWNLSWRLDGTFSSIDYPTNTSNRRDLRFYAGTSLTKRWFEGFSTTVDYHLTRNNSNLTTADFTKHVGTVAVSYEFF